VKKRGRKKERRVGCGEIYILTPRSEFEMAEFIKAW
jgi:hypothetical protein